jgi:hypothetical protein
MTTVESPFIDQLIDMGWKVVTGNFDQPSATGRETFREVLIKSDLRTAINRINLRDGKPCLDDARVSQVVSALERIAAPKLMEANQQATELLLTHFSTVRSRLGHWHGRNSEGLARSRGVADRNVVPRPDARSA